MEKTKGELIYLYCVTKTKPPRRNFEEIDIKTYPVYFRGNYAVVSRVCADEFSEDNLKKNLADIEWVEKKVRQHERVIEEIMRQMTVIPFKFATVFRSEESVKIMLKDRGAEFKKMLQDLEGKEEWGLKIYCDLKRFKESIEKEDRNIQEIKKEIASVGKGRAYLLKKKKEGLVKNITNERISEYTRDCFERLKKISLEAKINKILPKEVTQKEDDMVLNSTYLINKKRIKELTKVLEYLKAKCSDQGLSFDCTGPWPPYNFCNQ